MEPDPRTISDAGFDRLVHGFEQDWLEFKRGLRPDKDETKAEFCLLVGGLSNRGGGWLVIGPLPELREADRRTFDPAFLNQVARSSLGGIPILGIDHRQHSDGVYVLIEVPAPEGAPVMFRRAIGRFMAGQFPLREGTATQVVVESGRIANLFTRWSPGASRSQASAATDYAAHYFSQSSDLILMPGSGGQFATGYTNAGRRAWVKGGPGPAQLLLSPHQDYRQTVILEMLAAPVVATQANDLVNPGQVGFFIFNLRLPPDVAGGTRYAFHAHPCVLGTQIGPDSFFRVEVPQSPPAQAGLSDPSVTGITRPNASQVRVLFFSSAGLDMGDGPMGIRNANNYVLDGLAASGAFDFGSSRVEPDARSVTLLLRNPLQGTHSFLVRNIADNARRQIVPNPTPFTIDFG